MSILSLIPHSEGVLSGLGGLIAGYAFRGLIHKEVVKAGVEAAKLDAQAKKDISTAASDVAKKV